MTIPCVCPRSPSDPVEDPRVVRELGLRYLVWDTFVAGEARVSLRPLLLPSDLHVDAVRAAESTVALMTGVAARAHEDPLEREQYGFEDDVVRLVTASHQSADRSAFFRVDLLLADHGQWVACEVNADCPGGHNEALALPALSRNEAMTSAIDPSFVMGALVQQLSTLALRPDGSFGTVGLMFATAYAEDLQVCALLKRHLEAVGVPAVFASPTAPHRRGDELVVGERTVDVLYRFFPTEYMQGQSNIDDIAACIRLGRLKTVSSFSHMYVQSKASFARGWAMQSILSEPDREVLKLRTPPTFDVRSLSAHDLITDRCGWVVKRALGRVGDEVIVGTETPAEQWERIVDEVLARSRLGERWVAQRFVRQRTIDTPWGAMFPTLGAYVADGKFVGYFARVSAHSHVSHTALCVPVFIEARS